MSVPVAPPQANRGPIPYSSLSSAVSFSPPIGWVWIQSAGSGGLVVKDERGTTRTYAGLTQGLTLYGPFSELTSMTCAGIMVGDGTPPSSTQTSAQGVNGATVPAGGALTTGNVLQVSGASALSYGPVNLAGGENYVTGVSPWWNTSAAKTTTFSAAVDNIYYLNFTSAVVVDMPAISATNDSHAISFINLAVSAGVITPNGTQGVGGTAASSATAAAPAQGVMKTYIANAALSRWVALA